MSNVLVNNAEREGFVTYTATSHRGAIKILCFQFCVSSAKAGTKNSNSLQVIISLASRQLFVFQASRDC